MSEQTLIRRRDFLRASHREGAFDTARKIVLSPSESEVSRFVRGDNTLKNAKYLGYLDARDLYPDIQPLKLADYVDVVLAGDGQRPYEGRF